MSNSAQITTFKNQISSMINNVYSLDTSVDTLTKQQDACITRIELLEQELVELLTHKKKLVQDFDYMEELTSGDTSPMGRIQFVKSGVIEGTALESIQNEIIEQRQDQKDTLTKINDGVRKLKESRLGIEEDIELEKKQLLSINQSISDNQQRISQLRADILSVEGRMRTLT